VGVRKDENTGRRRYRTPRPLTDAAFWSAAFTIHTDTLFKNSLQDTAMATQLRR